MNYTQNHHLPQWVGSDPIRMDDFNQMNQDIEAGLDAAASRANAAASAAQAAQSSADAAAEAAASALSKANAAQAAASSAYSPDNKPYVTGSYTGAIGSAAINLPFRPSFLIISGMKPGDSQSDMSQFDRYFAMVSGAQMKARVQIISTGFAVFPKPTSGCYYPDLNEPGRTYDYIAFK